MTVTDEPAAEGALDVDEVHTPEVVAPSTAVVPAGDPAVHSALERAADAALAMPGIPGRDEFLSMAMQARILSMSAVAPKALRGNPHVAFHVVMIGRDLGISPSAAIELVDVIGDGQDARPSMSPQLLLGQIRRLGLGRIAREHLDDWSATAVALDPDGNVLGTSEFSWEDAQTAGLAGLECSPRDHSDKCGKKESAQRFKCRQGWRTYPRRMLWWRAAGYAAADYFPEAGLGLYAPEELGAMVDDSGRPIDPASVELPEGYEPAAPPAAPPAAKVEEAADPDALWALQVRIRALPDDQRAVLADKWHTSTRLTYDTADGTDRPPIPARLLPKRGLATAESMVTGLERLAQRAEGVWDPAEARAAVEETLGARAWALVPGMVWLYGWGAQSPVTDPPPPTPTERPAAPETGSDEGVPPDLSYSPEAYAEAEADVAGMTVTEVEDALRGWDPPVRITGSEDRDRARLAAVIAARIEEA